MNGMLLSKLLPMGVIGCYSIVFVFVIRLFLKRLGRKYCYYLWLIAFLNLCIPFSIFSSFSFIPKALTQLSYGNAAVSAPPEEKAEEETRFLIYMDSGIRAAEEEKETVIPSVPEVKEEPLNRKNLWKASEIIWLGGFLLLCFTGIFSVLRLQRFLKKNAQGSLSENERIVWVKNLTTPFVWGIRRPRIYLPDDIEEEELEYILAHEQCHLRRKDHLIKLWIYAVASVHWFHPLVWLAYSFCCKDMEISCDEEVLAHSEKNVRKAYAGSLLKYASKQNGYVLKPLTFGEPSLRSRVQNVLHYQKKGKMISAAAFLLTAVAAMGLFLRPENQQKIPEAPQEERLPEVSGNGSAVIRIGSRICYMLGTPLYSDGTSLYATQGEAGEMVFRRYGLEDASFTWIADGSLSGASADGKSLYYYTKDGNQLYVHRFHPQTDTFEENILGKALEADQITVFYDSGDALIFAAGSYEGSANLFNGNFYVYRPDRGKLLAVHLTDSEYFYVLGDRIYYEKFTHEEGGSRELYSADFSLKDERKISGNIALLQTDGKRNMLLAAENGTIFYMTPDGKERTELFSLADEGWTWEKGDTLYFREVSILDDEIYVKAEKWSDVDDNGWRSSLVKSQHFQIRADGSGAAAWNPGNYVDEYYESFAFYNETLPGRPLKNPQENGWNVKMASDVREWEKFSKLPYEPDENEKQKTYLLAKTEHYALYGKGDYETMLLESEGDYAEISYPYMSNYMIPPILWETDADGDGRNEAAICLNLQHGTGVSIDSFLMSDRWNDGNLYVYQFLDDEICEQMKAHLTWEITEEGCQPFVDGKKAGEIVKHPEDTEPFYAAGIGDQIHFDSKDGKVIVSSTIGFVTADVPYMAWYSDYEVTANVSLRNGKFVLSDFRSTPAP